MASAFHERAPPRHSADANLRRNLTICCDGTNNQFGSENTNVVRLVQALNRDPQRQRVCYDPGIGTLPEHEWVTHAGAIGHHAS
ncbi:MAG TPA: DUF2235 domain-containing protein [Terriglobales bacterium]|nr:DUF2235 domain-containing protein [Terriglobales bacterium]